MGIQVLYKKGYYKNSTIKGYFKLQLALQINKLLKQDRFKYNYILKINFIVIVFISSKGTISIVILTLLRKY